MLDTYLGSLALDCASVLDRSTGLVGRAPLVKELRDTMAQALAEGKNAGAAESKLGQIVAAARARADSN